MEEPVSALTDYVLGAVFAVLGGRLMASGRRQGQFCRGLCAVSFLAAALAAFLGGTVHGFSGSVGDLSRWLLWKATFYSLGFASFFLLSGVIFAVLSARTRRALLSIALLKLFLFVAWMTHHDSYAYVVYDYGLALIGVLLLQLYWMVSRDGTAGAWMVAGAVVSLLVAAIQQSAVSLHRHLGHNELYHLVQIVGTCLLYRGALALVDCAVESGG